MLPLRTGSARVPQVNKPHESGVGRKHKSSDGQQQLAAGAEAAVSRQGDHLIGAVAGRDQGGVGRLLAMPFDAGTELPLSLAGATPGLTCETWSTSRGALRCLPPPTSWRCAVDPERARRLASRPLGARRPGQVGVGGGALAILVLAVLRGRAGHVAEGETAAARRAIPSPFNEFISTIRPGREREEPALSVTDTR